MAYPVGVVTRTCTVGGGTALESGEPLILSVVVASSRGLIWASTGWRLPSLPRTVASTVGSEVTFELPVTSQAGYRSDCSPGTIIDVSAPGSYSHTYTATVTITTPTGGQVSRHIIGPFPLPAEDLSPVGLDTMLPVGTQAGGVVLVPDSLSARMVALEEAVAASGAGGAPDTGTRDVTALLSNGDAHYLNWGPMYHIRRIGPVVYFNLVLYLKVPNPSDAFAIYPGGTGSTVSPVPVGFRPSSDLNVYGLYHYAQINPNGAFVVRRFPEHAALRQPWVNGEELTCSGSWITLDPMPADGDLPGVAIG